MTQVDKDFRIISDAYPYIASRLLTDPSEELQAALQQLLFKEGALRWDRLSDLLQEATQVGDYDVSQALDQMVTYLASEQGRAVREALARDSVELFDRLESDTLDLLRSYLSRSGFDAPAALLRLAVSTGQQVGEGGLEVALNGLVDQLLRAVIESTAEPSSLHTVARTVRKIRESGRVQGTLAVDLLRKVCLPTNRPSCSLSGLMLFPFLSVMPMVDCCTAGPQGAGAERDTGAGGERAGGPALGEDCAQSAGII